MAASTHQNKVDRLRADVATLRKKLAQEKNKEAQKNKELTNTTRRLAKTKSASIVKTKENTANRLRREIASIQKSISDLERTIAAKTKELGRYEQRLSQEQLKHEKALTREARKRHQLERLQSRLSFEFPDYETPPHDEEDVRYDVFISHARQDKENFVEPLAELLAEMGFEVWYDDFVLKVGDSLRRAIDKGIANSEYGLVVLSPHFFAKRWTERELAG
jgi:chromosome segregation ATPase